MKNIILVLCFFSLLSSSIAQINSYDFPEDWIGEYTGTMLMYYPTASRVDTSDVFFELKELVSDSLWTYTMSYDSQKYGQSTKDYLIVKPSEDHQQLYHLDEKDGIIIEMRLMANTFYSNFSVMGSYLSSRMERVEGGIAFEIFTTKEESSNESYALVDPKDYGVDTIKVNSFVPFTVQRVFLAEVDK